MNIAIVVADSCPHVTWLVGCWLGCTALSRAQRHVWASWIKRFRNADTVYCMNICCSTVRGLLPCEMGYGVAATCVNREHIV